MSTITLRYLNHAAVLVELGPLRLLTDPWFDGRCFAGGWQLAHHNPDALELAATATHLWISHWHSDHFHVPTLKALARANPDIEVLANVSANFDMGPAMRRFGFHRITPLPERASVPVPGGAVTRYPTAGIDNMLLLEAAGRTVLNYNDCNLPRSALVSLMGRMPAIDVLLSNYNHAGRLFDDRAPDAIADDFWAGYTGVVDIIRPRWAVPFASAHRYISPASLEQNASLVDFDDLFARAAVHERVTPWRIGDSLSFTIEKKTHNAMSPPCADRPVEPRDYGEPVPWGTLRGAAGRRVRTLDRAFFGLTRLLGPLVVYAEDHDRRLVLTPGVGAHDGGRGIEDAHLVAHSRALHDWVGRRFGDDTFLAGAHFAPTARDPAHVQRWMLPATLEASELDPRHALSWLTSGAGRRFLWNRREEIAATVLGGRFRAGALRL